jgi:thioredoxin-like negative regulator of GroEL
MSLKPLVQPQRRQKLKPYPDQGFDVRVYGMNMLALAGLKHGLSPEPDRVFAVTREVSAEPAAIDVARALALVDAGRLAEAERVLRNEALLHAPDDEQALLLLASVLLRQNREGWREILDRLHATANDPEIRGATLAASRQLSMARVDQGSAPIYGGAS